jgi:hypothetical protein
MRAMGQKALHLASIFWISFLLEDGAHCLWLMPNCIVTIVVVVLVAWWVSRPFTSMVVRVVARAPGRERTCTSCMVVVQLARLDRLLSPTMRCWHVCMGMTHRVLGGLSLST